MNTREWENWEHYASDDTVAQTRAIVRGKLADEFARRDRQRFEQNMWGRRGAPPQEVRALVLSVAQYWADNADDEVHLAVHVTARDTDLGVHACGASELDGCRTCVVKGPDLDVDMYGALVPAFEAFCHEHGEQNRDRIDNYRPWAVARASGVEVIGVLVRPWLDLPSLPTPTLPADDRLADLVAACRSDRHACDVLADELERRGLPRDMPARTWLGELEPHVPRSAMSIVNGVPDAIGLWLADPHVELHERLPATRVRFLPTSEQVMWPGLATARAIGPLHESALEDLATCGQTFACEELEIDVRVGDFDAAVLRAALAQMPRLRKLVAIGRAVDAIEPVLRELSIERVVAPHVDDADQHVAAVARWRAIGAGVAMFDTDAVRATGWVVRPDGAIDHAGYHRHADDARLAALRAAVAG